MATARKAPAKRAASARNAAPATKTARRTQAKAPAKAVNGAAHAIARKSQAKKAASDDVTVASRGNGAARAGKAVTPSPASRKRVRATAANGAAAKASATKGEGASVQALVRDPQHEGEVVRKSRAITPEAAVPVQIGGLKPEVTRPAYWDKACADLVKRDRILKKLIPKFGPVHLINRDDPFTTLARSVVGQQISVRAAQSIWERVESACAKLAPQQFIKLGHEKLQACGLSKRKSEYILDLAQHFQSGALHVDTWTSMDDEAVIAELTQIRGIGRWTAEMFLIFNLSRPNVLPLDDLGLIQAISVNYFSGEPVTRSEAREVAANWEPWRTVATWYMWRSLDPIPADH
ncbi:HhH-GPD superfamily base excision DNA repair protein [Caballeronia arationis]|uniref:DNA-3-methyladenine glycosylase II n=1 Tax=Caballeronia arationis TaxID=1777142 RepID=A0A7Z7IAJ9_9BURK|nr:DNA-3-methyladenine glycosylase [Caballeronia arationis]SAK68175.1 HhH-GPD superfamily base excision DNA repair protein [Caballeronia arationis]SOE81982.1 DNA-3-methyladenine glycosylase II [Caballeronia arationis]